MPHHDHDDDRRPLTGPIPTLNSSVPVLEDAADRDIACRADDHDRARTRHRVTGMVIAVLTTLSAIGPFATDMYIPAFPRVTSDLGTSAANVQLTLTAFFLGAAMGQIVAGPLSDRLGRRIPLLVGIVLCMAGSIGCALAGNIDMLLITRLIQGIGGGFGMVLGRAVLIDLTDGPEMVRLMNILQGIGGIAPIIAPLIGGMILLVGQWREIFIVIAGMSVLSLIGTLLLIPESLPREHRHPGGLRTFAKNCLTLCRRRRFIGYLLVNASSGMTLMAYVSASSYVVQEILGFRSEQYSVVFAINAFGMMTMAFMSARLTRRYAARSLIRVGQSVSAVGAVALLVGALWLGTPVWIVLPGFFVVVLAQGFIFGNGAALASAEAREFAGTASAMLGLGFSCAASAAAPLVGLAGTSSAVPMAIVMVGGALMSMVCLYVIARPAPSENSAASAV
ncbi:multidrug effflux MFS transporter [Devriesea agamarum]|uniref:multidrug effflux MFS transporter n=1 Tax=Devriesea agamarum TaxID=472569 RepID=UPI00071E2C78|nr:multidrug effflux MFS transporter [Devriesea agamarum]